VVYFKVIFTVGFMVFASSIIAEEGVVSVVPEHEHKSAEKLGSVGPTETKGIKSVKSLGEVSLSGEFKSLDGRFMRARELTISPGGVVAVHRHDARPGVAYILEGEIIEFRNDAAHGILRKRGEVSFEKTGVVHWWENKSDKMVRALVVDIIESNP